MSRSLLHFPRLLNHRPNPLQAFAHGYLSPLLHNCPMLQPPLPTSPAERSNLLIQAVGWLSQRHPLPPPRGEFYPILEQPPGWNQPPDDAWGWVDRAYMPLFGFTAYGVHVNGYNYQHGALHLWVGERSANRPTAPSKLDHLVAGGVALGLSLRDTLYKEADEEAGIAPALLATARPTGYVRYAQAHALGLKRDVLFTVDLPLPLDFTPRNHDGEMAGFHLLPATEVLALVRDSDGFKENVNLVLLDFFIRHGVITPDDPDYLALPQALRQDIGA